MTVTSDYSINFPLIHLQSKLKLDRIILVIYIYKVILLGQVETKRSTLLQYMGCTACQTGNSPPIPTHINIHQ